MFELIGSRRGVDTIERCLLLYVTHLDQCLIESVLGCSGGRMEEEIVDEDPMSEYRPATCKYLLELKQVLQDKHKRKQVSAA